jgi:thiol:disulfide interchange protein DsbD
MGLVLGPLAAPCVGPFVGTVLVNIARHQGIVSGALQLFTFALGMGVLFVTVGTFSTALPRSGDWLIKLKQTMGVIVLAFAAWNIRLVVPDWLNLALWSVVLLTATAVLEAFKPAEGFVPTLRKGLGWLALALTILLGLRAVESALNLELLPRGTGITSVQSPAEQLWIQQDLETALARAKQDGKLVLVDTYAEWCAQCKELDAKTWPDAQVTDWIRRNAVAVRIDTDKVRPDLAERFKITGYPTILILNGEGKEQRRTLGFLEPKEMLAFLEGR